MCRIDLDRVVLCGCVRACVVSFAMRLIDHADARRLFTSRSAGRSGRWVGPKIAS